MFELNFVGVSNLLCESDHSLGNLITIPLENEDGQYVFRFSSGHNITIPLEMLMDYPSVSKDRVESALASKRLRENF